MPDAPTPARPKPATRGKRSPLPRIIGAVVLVALVIAMALNTKFLTPEEVAAIAPKKFDAAETAAGLWSTAQSDLPGQASDLGESLSAIQADPKSAAEQYNGVSPNENAFDYPVKAVGTVTAASDATLQLEVDGAPSQTPIFVPLSVAVNGSPVRDLLGFKFADAPGQTDYQYVSDELKKLMQSEVSEKVDDPSSLKGKQVTVVGVVSVVSTGSALPKAQPISIQPVTIEVS